MPSAQINGLELHYEVAGDGPPLLLLHGLGSSAADWDLQVPAFAERYRVITVDLPRHGRSQAGALRYTVEQMAEDVAGLLGQLGLPPAHVVGLSLGGCVAQVLAAWHPERVRSAVLVNTFARLRPTDLPTVGHLLKRTWLFFTGPMPVVAAYVAAGLFPKPEQQALYAEAVARLSRNPKRAYLAGMLAVGAFDGRGLLSSIRCPTLVVAGDRDITVPRAAVEALHRGIPGARFALVEDSGHVTPYDQPEEFNNLVLGFLASVDQGATRQGSKS